jgi:hypothetical protein
VNHEAREKGIGNTGRTMRNGEKIYIQYKQQDRLGCHFLSNKRPFLKRYIIFFSRLDF